MSFSMSLLAHWAPRDMRLKPSLRSSLRSFSLALSGLAYSVTSASRRTRPLFFSSVQSSARREAP